MSASLHVRRAKNGKPAVHPIRSTAQKTLHARADAHSTAEQINGFSAAHVRPGSLVFVSCRAPKFDTARQNAFRSDVAIWLGLTVQPFGKIDSGHYVPERNPARTGMNRTVEAVPRRDRAVVIAAVAILTMLAWADMIWLADDMAMGGMDMTEFWVRPSFCGGGQWPSS